MDGYIVLGLVILLVLAIIWLMTFHLGSKVGIFNTSDIITLSIATFVITVLSTYLILVGYPYIIPTLVVVILLTLIVMAGVVWCYQLANRFRS